MADLSYIGGRITVFFILFFLLLTMYLNQTGLLSYLSSEVTLQNVVVPTYRTQQTPVVFENVLRGYNFTVQDHIVSFSMETGTIEQNVELVVKVTNLGNNTTVEVYRVEIPPYKLQRYPITFTLLPGSYNVRVELQKDGIPIKYIERVVEVQ